MTYFSARVPFADGDRPRVGLTVGKAIGKAVERNRIKRRMREAVRANLRLLPAEIAVVLHPRRAVLEIGFPQLKAEVERIFLKVAGQRIAAQMHAGAERVDGQAAQLRQPGSTETARTSGAGCAH
jgi:ribonuclease P protein component